MVMFLVLYTHQNLSNCTLQVSSAYYVNYTSIKLVKRKGKKREEKGRTKGKKGQRKKRERREGGRKRPGPKSETWVGVLHLSFPCCVSVGKLHSVSLSFLFYKTRFITSTSYVHKVCKNILPYADVLINIRHYYDS